MKRLFLFTLLISLSCTTLFSCKKIVEGINTNPNQLISVSVNEQLTGPMLAQVVINTAHLQRISGMWTGQYIGQEALYEQLYQYSISTAETASTWEFVYNGILLQVRDMRSRDPSNTLLQAICKILEAHAIGTATALFGDIPYSEVINPDISDPKFDSQLTVYQAVQTLLDSAISDLGTISGTPFFTQDIFFGQSGGHTKWLEVAYTLKARYYTNSKEYENAYNAAQNGISANDNSMYFKPPSNPVPDANANLLYTFIGERGGFMTTAGTFYADLLTAGSAISRNHTKTNEEARAFYYSVGGSDETSEKGVARIDAWMPLVTYEENVLTLAESALRSGKGVTEALGYLNQHRAHLMSQDVIFKSIPTDGRAYVYMDFVEADFNSGGIENMDGSLSASDALLREIIEERYVTFFGQLLAFNDMRRLRKSDQAVSLYHNASFPLNVSTATQLPERFPYSQDELNANANAPTEPGIYEVTEANR